MHTWATAHPLTQMKTQSQSSFRRRCAQARPAGVAIGLAGGLLAGVCGLLLTAVAWFVADANAHALIARIAVTLLVLMIPLLMLGAGCLDSLEGNRGSGQSRMTCDDDDEEE